MKLQNLTGKPITVEYHGKRVVYTPTASAAHVVYTPSDKIFYLLDGTPVYSPPRAAKIVLPCSADTDIVIVSATVAEELEHAFEDTVPIETSLISNSVLVLIAEEIDGETQADSDEFTQPNTQRLFSYGVVPTR